MKKFFSIVVIVLAGCSQMRSELPRASGDYRLVWADEFNKDGELNPKDWNFERGWIRNNELQWYQPENAICRDGMLIIEARREAKPDPIYDPKIHEGPLARKSIEYTSSSITTQNKHSFIYGRFEIRARINTQQGSWPAFWMLGNSRSWPSCGEVDIMEYYRQMLLANVAWAGKGGGGAGGSVWNSVRIPLDQLGKDWSNQFHIWRMDWEPATIKLYCDDKLLNTQDLTTAINGRGISPSHPFQQPAFIMLNQAIGSQGGDPAKTDFPIRFEIDYLRVFQK